MSRKHVDTAADMIAFSKSRSIAYSCLSAICISADGVIIRVDDCTSWYWECFEEIYQIQSKIKGVRFVLSEKSLRRRLNVRIEIVKSAIDEDKLEAFACGGELLITLDSAIAFRSELLATRRGS